ncbi:MAG: bifunctional diaminohydroxyphosphoribosylaminopyrimidine deaminase/5-amino-6-(5-phosphoribosylamino)uracil reductase RibD [Candidatus Diapherotrites archaeon]|nr:bifunctional diaminohydroxyphosphoribosylaminopyrimidine deaminase/5-amino-6-(5-phosphoribosylamino)uracil reductase RibD [Candidatus Diapherotrites archaeon]
MKKKMKTGKEYMELALRLAARGSGRVLPNPRVGAVIVKNGKIVGQGFHKHFGGAHAEANALKMAGKKAQGATIYLTLEPCTGIGKQPPCAHALVKAGIKEAVIAALDPNEGGRGARHLKKHGIKVTTGAMEEEALELNKDFNKHAKTGKPFVLVKTAISLDGKISYGDGKSKQISSAKSREKAVEMRKWFSAIMVGKNTVIKDNPLLTSRDKKNTPIRIIATRNCRLPQNARVFSKDAHTIVTCTRHAAKKDIEKIISKGAGVLLVEEKNGKIDTSDMLSKLGQAGIASIMVEGGARTITELLLANECDGMILCVSPFFIGKGTSIVEDTELFRRFEFYKAEKVGPDYWLHLRRHDRFSKFKS